MPCPRCHAALAPEGLGQVVVDVCRRCGGVWLDKGELEHLRTDQPRFPADSDSQRGASFSVVA